MCTTSSDTNRNRVGPRGVFSTLSTLQRRKQLERIRSLHVRATSLNMSHRKGQCVIFGSGSCLNVARTGRMRRTTTGTIHFNAKDNKTHLASKTTFRLSGLRGRVTSFGRARSTIVFGAKCVTGLKILCTLTKGKSIVFDSRLGRTDVISKYHVSGTRATICERDSVTSLRELLRAIPYRKRHFVIASNMFDVSKSVYPLPTLTTLGGSCETYLVISSTRTSNIVNEANQKATRCFHVTKVSIRIKALSGTFNTRKKCVTTDQRVYSCLQGASQPFVFSATVSTIAKTTTLTTLHLLGTSPRGCLNHLHRGATCVQGLLARAKINVTTKSAPVVPITIKSRGRTLTATRTYEGRKVLLSTVHPPSMPIKADHVQLAMATIRAGRRLRGTTSILVER